MVPRVLPICPTPTPHALICFGYAWPAPNFARAMSMFRNLKTVHLCSPRKKKSKESPFYDPFRFIEFVQFPPQASPMHSSRSGAANFCSLCLSSLKSLSSNLNTFSSVPAVLASLHVLECFVCIYVYILCNQSAFKPFVSCSARVRSGLKRSTSQKAAGILTLLTQRSNKTMCMVKLVKGSAAC